VWAHMCVMCMGQSLYTLFVDILLETIKIDLYFKTNCFSLYDYENASVYILLLWCSTLSEWIKVLIFDLQY
jgi:hypothetical protein